MSGWPFPTSPYHKGEIATQERAGARDAAEHTGRKLIRDVMPDQHRDFFALLPYLTFATLDDRRRPWAGILVGAPGFARSPDPRHLDIAALPTEGDPSRMGLRLGAPIGLVGVEMHTRRRNRMNGRITATDDHGFSVLVGQSFGNCPKYIQARQLMDQIAAKPPARVRPLAALDDREADILAKADMCFIASASPAAGSEIPEEGVDVSYRGGRPGFLRLSREGEHTVVTFPDFSGNRIFNTLGNILANPVAGLLVPDFATGAALSLTGRAEALWDDPDVDRFAGAERLVRVVIEEAVLIEDLLPASWSEAIPAPQLAATGIWSEVERARDRD